jgi:iron complex transport system substrate-binding protein
VKRVFVDANIVIDLLCERYPWFPKVLRIFSMGDLGQIELFCSSLSLGTASYIMETRKLSTQDIFDGIEKRYNDIKALAAKSTTRPTVFSGEMHSGTWHAVGGKNYLAQIFRDAGANYVIQDEETAGENLEFEKMYALAADADYWRILNSFPGDFSYEALKSSEPRNELFKAFKDRKVIYCNMKQQPYYEITPVQPDVLLKDFVAIFHPELVESDYQPTYYKLLK